MSERAAHITWEGAGDHAGHTVQFRERWRHQVEGATVIFTEPKVTISGGVLTCGRVQCSCGEGWTVGGWPPEVVDRIDAEPLPTAAPSSTTGADGGA